MDMSIATVEERLEEYKSAHTITKYLTILAVLIWFWGLFGTINYTIYSNRLQKTEPVYYYGTCVNLSERYHHLGADMWILELDNGLILGIAQDKSTQFDEDRFRQIMSNELCYVLHVVKGHDTRIMGIRNGEEMLVNENNWIGHTKGTVFVLWFGVSALLLFPLICFFSFLYYKNEYKLLYNKVSTTKVRTH